MAIHHQCLPLLLPFNNLYYASSLKNPLQCLMALFWSFKSCEPPYVSLRLHREVLYYFLIPLSKLQGFIHDANAHPLKLVFFNQLSFIHFDNEHQLAKTIILLLSIESDHRLLELLKIHKNIVERIHFKGLSASFLSILLSHCASYTMISSYHFPSTYVTFYSCKLQRPRCW